jgi:c-di-GMP-related signal transduction protein
MKALGYQIALDDFQHCEKMEGLIALADYIKVDFRLSCKEERREIIRLLKRNATTLVAEKIETNEEFEMALGEGFRLFQGYYLGRPKVFSKRELPTNDMNRSQCENATEPVMLNPQSATDCCLPFVAAGELSNY